RPLIIREATGDIEILQKKDGGLPLGIQKDFPYKSNTFKLNPGDTFFLYTDGLEDALNVDGKRYKIESSISLIKDSLHKDPPLQINMSLLKSVKEYIGDTNQFDDIGMLTIKYYGTN
ncbi:MAG TPA: PP2C family protein-serine/threonine phosphatase, partial [Segetibacter sp.]|nr:PP2C family protein-serine/threonine phosphatase [Segetibacter sp.]